MQASPSALHKFEVDYVAILRGVWRRHKVLVVGVFFGIAVPGLLFAHFTNTTLYVSKAVISIEPSGLAQIPFLKEPPRRDQIMTYMVLLKSHSLSEAVLEALPKESYDELLAMRQHVDYFAPLKNTIRRWQGMPPRVLSPHEEALAELRLGRMEFSQVKEAENVFVITATATRPRVAVDLVNTHIQVLLQRARSVDQEDSRRSREFLESQYQQVKESLARAEDSVAKLQQQRGRTRSGTQTELELVRLAQLETALSDTQATRQVLSTRLATLRRSWDQARSQDPRAATENTVKENQKDDETAAASLAAEYQARTNAFKAAQEQLARTEAKLASLRERYTDAHPQVQMTRDEIARQQARVTQLARELPSAPAPTRTTRGTTVVPATPSDRVELQNQIVSLERESDALATKEETLKLQVARLRDNLRNLSQDDVDFGNLRRSVEANRNLLALLSDRLMAARIRERGDSSVIRVVDPALLPFPPQTTSPKTQKLALMVLALAGGLAFGLAFGIEFLHQPVETEADILKATSLTVLGSVGVMESLSTSNSPRREKKPIVLPAHPVGTFAGQNRPIHLELYRAMRANIETERLKSPFRSVLVTSPGPHEGKSTTILNLAHVCQEFGRRVLVVDGDLRRPSLASPLALTNRPGVVDYLHGTATLEQVCRRLPSGVTVIPGQVSRGDAATLFASARFKELLHVAGTSFDLILVDSAPILAVPDNLLLAGSIDRVILVAKATHTSTRDLRKAQAAIERAGGRLLGVVLNGAHASDVPYYHPRYRKYYTPSTAKDAQVTSRRVPPGRSG
jgi:polysaccharide biosynthesis transport protein